MNASAAQSACGSEPGRGVVRLLHTADVHLGARDSLFGEAAERMREARRHFVRNLPELARQHDVAGVVIAGDLFDSADAVPEEGKYVGECLRGLAGDGRFVVLTPGTHDGEVTLRDLGPALVLDRPDFADCKVVEAAGHRLHFYGGAYDPLETPEDFLAPLRGDKGPGFHVAVLHASVAEEQSRFGRRDLPVTPGQLAQCGCDYVALGHFHSFHRVEADGRLVGAYPGTPVPRKFSESGPRRVVLVELSGRGVTLTPLALRSPRTEVRTLDVTGMQDLGRIESECIGSLQEVGEEPQPLADAFLELTLRGTWELDAESPADLAAALRSRLGGLRLHDETHRLDADYIDRLAAQSTPEGVFVRLLRERQAEAPESQSPPYERALVEGLSVIQGLRRETS